jgi:FAD/FMN-containing dehydrogenase
MNGDLTSGDHLAEVNPGDPLYRDLQLRGYNRRFVGTSDRVFVVRDTDQVVNAVDVVVASGKKLAVRSGGHCMADPRGVSQQTPHHRSAVAGA